MKLYHFSEEESITSFEPHVAKTSAQAEAYVWGIDEDHAPMYYMPRDCPRACFWPGEGTSDEDRERWFGGIEARMVIAVESDWLERIRSATLYCYEMPPDTFELLDGNAGHWVSQQRVEPLSVEPVRDLLEALAAANVELRVTPGLMQLCDRIDAGVQRYEAAERARLRGVATGWSRDGRRRGVQLNAPVSRGLLRPVGRRRIRST